MALTQDLHEALARLSESLERNPHRRGDLAERAVLENLPRPHATFYLNRQADPSAGEVMNRVAPTKQSPEERLLGAVRGLTGSLAMHNPIRPRIGLGHGPGTLASSFGIKLDAELGYTASGSRPLDEVIAEGAPDPETSGVIPGIRADIDAARRLTPEWIEIGLPDMQGPFNIAHAVLGDAVFTAPLLEPRKFHDFMALVADFFIALHRNLKRWIGPERLPRFTPAVNRICECSVNLISPDMYVEHVLPHDLRVAEYYGQTAIHPCSGPHVFKVTLRHLPTVVCHEAGFVDRAAAGAISVDDALAEIGDRPIILSIGQELPEGREEEFIRRDFDRARTNHRLLFSYTGMHWKKRDEERIREMHLRLDEYWEGEVYTG